MHGLYHQLYWSLPGLQIDEVDSSCALCPVLVQLLQWCQNAGNTRISALKHMHQTEGRRLPTHILTCLTGCCLLFVCRSVRGELSKGSCWEETNQQRRDVTQLFHQATL